MQISMWIEFECESQYFQNAIIERTTLKIGTRNIRIQYQFQNKTTQKIRQAKVDPVMP